MSSCNIPRFGDRWMQTIDQPTEIERAMHHCVGNPLAWLKTQDVINKELWEQHKVHVESCLSRGGNSQTFNVIVEGRQSPYCMKISSQPEDRDVFQQEAENLQTLQKLDPLHTVRLHQSFNYQFAQGVDNAVLIEKYGGKTLAAKYRMDPNIKIPISHIGHIAAQMVVFLRALEKAGKVLGDITPTNIVVSDDPSAIGSLKFIDVAELFNEGDWIPNCYRTTRWYRSPMVLTGRANRSERFFPIGCILFELITEKPLFDTHETIMGIKKLGVDLDHPYGRLELHLDAVDQIVPMTPAFKKQVAPDVIREVFLNANPEDLRVKSFNRTGSVSSLKDRVIKALQSKPDRLVYNKSVHPDSVLDSSVELLQRLLDYENPPSTDEIMKLPFFTKVFPEELDLHLHSVAS